MASVTSSGFGTANTNATASVTPTGTDRAGLAFVASETSSSGVTWGGNAMTLVDTQATNYFGVTFRLYRIEGVAAESTSVIASGSGRQIVYAVALDGADQTNCVGSVQKAGNEFGANPAITGFTAAVGQLLVGGVSCSPDAGGVPSPAGTEIIGRSDPYNGDYQGVQWVAALSTSPTLDWTAGSSGWGGIGVVVADASGPPPDPPGKPEITPGTPTSSGVTLAVTPGSGADSHALYIGTASPPATLYDTYGAAPTSIPVTGLDPSTPYFVMLRAINDDGDTDSDIETFTTAAPTPSGIAARASYYRRLQWGY